MKRLLLIILVGTLLSSCGSQPTGEPGPSQIPESPSRGRCGDGVCDGPENPERCPQDCGVDVPEATVASPTACQLPNPIRASISTDILEWKDWLEDGSFEEGELQMVVTLSPSSVYKPPSVQPGPEAARTGSVGIRITAGPDQSGIVGIAALIEKGEATRFSFWVRSQGGQVRLEPKVYGVEKHISEVLDGPAEPGGMFEVGSEWTPIQFEIFNRQGLRFALLALQVGPDMTLDIDDVKIESQIWGMAEVNGPSRVVGEVDVPQTPVAPLHFSVLIHIEDPQALELSESYFQVQSTIFRELARTFNEHGGFLTIQPEEDWVLGAAIHEPQLLRELAQEYGVQYSVHTHGPSCRDDQGRLRSNTDCQENRQTAGWDHDINARGYPEVVEYVRNLRDLLEGASGSEVTDLNGNFDFSEASLLSEVPMLTWSAYKSPITQATYDALIVNPWRPTQTNAHQDIDQFLTHDPETAIIYVPGWGQAITRHPERVLERLRPMVSQFIAHVDPTRVNTLYVVTHVGHFQAERFEDQPDYLSYDPASGKVRKSSEFEADIAAWDTMLSELIDPLVAEGYLQWTSLPEMGALYLDWERACGAE